MTARYRTIGYESAETKPDGGWGHFKPSRWGQCKPWRRVTAASLGDHHRSIHLLVALISFMSYCERA
jgi:hypothetical protein